MASYLDKTGLQYFWDQIKTKFATLAFKTIRVTNNNTNTDIQADTTADMLTFIAGTNITLTPNATTDTITIAAASGAQPTSTTPKMDGTAAVGSETTYARGDHVHPSDTSKISDPSIKSSGQYLKYNGTDWEAAAVPAGTVTSVRVQATSPVQSSVSTAQTGTLNTTISLATGYGDTKNPYGLKQGNMVLAGPTENNVNAAPSFRALVADDIPTLTKSKISDFPVAGTDYVVPSTLNSYLTTADAASTYATKSEITNVYKYKGSVATEAALPSTGLTAGDVYNIEASSSYGPAGTNVAWDGTAWDALGGLFTITSITTAEIDAIVAA